MFEAKISQRALLTPPSPIRRLSHLARAAKNSGAHVYHLNIGQPDIESPEQYFTGLTRFKEKLVAYENSQGNDALRASWSSYANRTLGLKTEPADFLITTGACGLLVGPKLCAAVG